MLCQFKALKKTPVVHFQHLSQFPGIFFTYEPFSVLHFRNMSLGNTGFFGKLSLGQPFLIARTCQTFTRFFGFIMPRKSITPGKWFMIDNVSQCSFPISNMLSCTLLNPTSVAVILPAKSRPIFFLPNPKQIDVLQCHVLTWKSDKAYTLNKIITF